MGLDGLDFLKMYSNEEERLQYTFQIFYSLGDRHFHCWVRLHAQKGEIFTKLMSQVSLSIRVWIASASLMQLPSQNYPLTGQEAPDVGEAEVHQEVCLGRQD